MTSECERSVSSPHSTQPESAAVPSGLSESRGTSLLRRGCLAPNPSCSCPLPFVASVSHSCACSRLSALLCSLLQVKSVLVMAGALKRSEPDLHEDIVLVRAMINSNVPKFLPDDLPLFGALIQDLFPGLAIPDTDYGELDTAIRHSIDTSGLQQVPGFVTKVVQLYDTFLVRFGVMIVGPTGSGVSQHTRKATSQICSFVFVTHMVLSSLYCATCSLFVCNLSEIRVPRCARQVVDCSARGGLDQRKRPSSSLTYPVT